MPLVALQKLRGKLRHLNVTAEIRADSNAQIAESILHSAGSFSEPDFWEISSRDLRCLFDAYDAHYFRGQLRRTLNDIPLEFRVSSRMTKAGGKTSSWRAERNAPAVRFEIAISSTLLFHTFSGVDIARPIRVTGLACSNRLEALMRVMEHEIVHLSELMGWNASSCRQDRFRSIAFRTFGHTDHRHTLATPREHASTLGILAGAAVHFNFRGKRLYGIVNRVTRRATVLVPDPDGERFSDGQTYLRYYVPLQSLELVASNAG